MPLGYQCDITDRSRETREASQSHQLRDRLHPGGTPGFASSPQSHMTIPPGLAAAYPTFSAASCRLSGS